MISFSAVFQLQALYFAYWAILVYTQKSAQSIGNIAKISNKLD